MVFSLLSDLCKSLFEKERLILYPLENCDYKS